MEPPELSQFHLHRRDFRGAGAHFPGVLPQRVVLRQTQQYLHRAAVKILVHQIVAVAHA